MPSRVKCPYNPIMGLCLSSTRVSGSSSNAAAAAAVRQGASDQNQNNRPDGAGRNNKKKQPEGNNRGRRRQTGGVIPCGKKTDFGYAKDFDRRYTIGKLLGHGQFGYTYVATDRASGDRVAVKRIEKNKVTTLLVRDV